MWSVLTTNDQTASISVHVLMFRINQNHATPTIVKVNIYFKNQTEIPDFKDFVHNFITVMFLHINCLIFNMI